MSTIYLDHNATTRLHPLSRAAMDRHLDDDAGNPSSVHGPGRRAREAVEQGRAEVAALIAAAPEEIVFTSGGTESDNLAVLGGARWMRATSGRQRVIASPLEHPAVLGSLDVLAAEGFEVALLPVAGDGTIDPAALGALLDGRTALVTVQAANHEIGARYPLAELVELTHRAGAIFHSDAVQAAGKVALDVRALGVDLLTLSAHKIYGPKGVGALYERRGIEVIPLVVGGHQERARRAGTENVVGVVGFGAACAIARRELAAWAERTARLRDRLETGALAIAGARRFGPVRDRVPGTSSLGFAGVAGDLLLMSLDLCGVAVATGAACTSGSLEPSRVIQALGHERRVAAEAVRFSLGRETTEEEIDEVLALLPPIIERIRAVR